MIRIINGYSYQYSGSSNTLWAGIKANGHINSAGTSTLTIPYINVFPENSSLRLFSRISVNTFSRFSYSNAWAISSCSMVTFELSCFDNGLILFLWIAYILLYSLTKINWSYDITQVFQERCIKTNHKWFIVFSNVLQCVSWLFSYWNVTTLKYRDNMDLIFRNPPFSCFLW